MSYKNEWTTEPPARPGFYWALLKQRVTNSAHCDDRGRTVIRITEHGDFSIMGSRHMKPLDELQRFSHFLPMIVSDAWMEPPCVDDRVKCDICGKTGPTGDWERLHGCVPLDPTQAKGDGE